MDWLRHSKNVIHEKIFSQHIFNTPDDQHPPRRRQKSGHRLGAGGHGRAAIEFPRGGDHR